MTKTEILLMIATASTTLCVVNWVKRLGHLIEEPLAETSKKVVEAVEDAVQMPHKPKWPIDLATGRQIEIDPETGQEYFID